MSEKVFQKVFQKMIGQPCWGVYHGQFGLSFNVGNPKLVVNCCKNDPVKDRRIRKLTHVQGEWGFRLTHAYWKLIVLSSDGKKKMVATVSSKINLQYQACRLLTGQRLTSVEINNKTGKTILGFDLGAELIIRRWEASTDDLWSLAEPNGYFLGVNGDGTYSHVPGSGLDNRPAVNNRPLKRAFLLADSL